MRKRFGSKVEMWRTVRNLAAHTTYAALIAGVPGIAAVFASLGDLIEQVEALDVSREGQSVGVGPAKAVAERLLINVTGMVDGIFTAYAAQTNNDLMLAEVNKELSDLRNMRDEELRAHCQYLQSQIPSSVPAPLTNLGLTPALVDLFEARYATFYALMTLPQDRMAQESTFVQLLEAQEKAGDRLLDLQLDKLMRQFIESSPELYTAYREARVIMDAATVKKKVPVGPIPPAEEPEPDPTPGS